MIPKKPEDLFLPTAKETDSSEDLVKAVISFYWSEVRSAIVQMKGHQIIVEGLGTFKVKAQKVPELAAHYTSMLARYNELKNENKMTFQRFSIMKEIELRLNRVNKLQAMIDEDQCKKQIVKSKRNEGNNNMEK